MQVKESLCGVLNVMDGLDMMGVKIRQKLMHWSMALYVLPGSARIVRGLDHWLNVCNVSHQCIVCLTLLLHQSFKHVAISPG